MLASTMIQLNLLWRALENGGKQWEKRDIQMPQN